MSYLMSLEVRILSDIEFCELHPHLFALSTKLMLLFVKFSNVLRISILEMSKKVCRLNVRLLANRD